MMKAYLSRVVRGDSTKEQAKDTGMAMVLILLLFWVARHKDGYIGLAILIHLITMVAPQVFRPIAVLWFGLSHIMGIVASKVLLGIVFFAVVTPIGLWRRMSGADSLKLRAFKSGPGSVMKNRDHTFVGKDLEQPY